MREIEIGTKIYTTSYALDDMEFGANHLYEIRLTPAKDASKVDTEIFARIKFQKGPIKEYGKNGIHNEDLVAVVIDRLQGFQETEFNCRENALAITKLEEALMWLNKRTQDRRKRNVEGISKI